MRCLALLLAVASLSGCTTIAVGVVASRPTISLAPSTQRLAFAAA
ncbi:MAG TPA: hypothetical protein VGQ83_23625 [Polyangia bacterium]|jgi:uncharacterized protein YceK